MTAWTPSEAQLQAWGLLSEDYNPLHFDTAFATEQGFVGRIVFGALALARIEGEIRETIPDQGVLIDVRFRRPMPVGDEMSVRFDSHAGRASVRLRDDDVVTGTVEIMDGG